MHLSGSTVTMPLACFWVAPTGQTVAQAGSSQWLHSSGVNVIWVLG